MDDTQRKITKIAREAAKFTVQTMKAEGIGTAEFDFIHLVRHKPGITQAEIRETLKSTKEPLPGRLQAWKQRAIWYENQILKINAASFFLPQKKRKN